MSLPGESSLSPRLTVVGTGIQVGRQTTPEARFAIESAERVFHLLNSPVAEAWIRSLHPRAESLSGFFREGTETAAAYRSMVEHVLAALAEGARVCVAFYGHPAVHVSVAHDLLHRAREAGCTAVFLPGVSFEDCLFADLGLDPATRGCRSYDATDFLVHGRSLDPRSTLVLWQAGGIGFGEAAPAGPAILDLLREKLASAYPRTHELILYEAALLPGREVRAVRVPLAGFPGAALTLATTLVVPPLPPPAEPDPEMVMRLELET